MSSVTITQKQRAKECGTLSYDGLSIGYVWQPHEPVFLPMTELALIGEYTNDHGPFGEDYFLVFLSRGTDGWLEVPWGAVGTREVCEKLSNELNVSLQSGLANRTDYASRILWPPGLLDQPMFDFRPVVGTGFLRRLKLLLAPEIVQELSPDALSTIRRRTENT